VSESQTLLLAETGVEHLPDGSSAVNVGPIVRALKFLTEGRGDDRGTDEAGNPLPDLMSLAFAVVEAIIVGGRKAEYFRQVMRDLEAQGSAGRSSLSLAKEARRVQRPEQAGPLDHASEALEDVLAQLRGGALDEQTTRDAAQALEAFRAFGADRWLSASAQLLVALSALAPARSAEPEPPRRPARRKAKRAARVRAEPPAKAKPRTKTKARPASPPTKPRAAKTTRKPARQTTKSKTKRR
jgi:hypothetical protein